MKYSQDSAKPNRKVIAATVGAVIGSVVAGALENYAGVTLPVEALRGLEYLIGSTLGAFVAGYVVKEDDRVDLVPVEGEEGPDVHSAELDDEDV